MFAPESGCGSKRPPHRETAKTDLVAVVTALSEEFEAIAPRVSQAERRRVEKGRGGILLKGRIGGVPALLAMTGDGAARASGSVSFLLGEFPVSLLVGAGAAGALVPSLRAGEVVVAQRLVDESGEAPPPDAEILSRAVALGARPATIVTLRNLVCSSKEKKDLASRFGFSESAAAVVDTESAAWARAAARRGVAGLVLRAVSDTFEEDLPGFLASCRHEDGSVDRAAVARRLLFHPGALPPLLRARDRVRTGAANIGLFLGKLLSEKI